MFLRKNIHNEDERADSVFSDAECATGGKKKFRLPKLEMPKFGGELRDWLCFWGLFRKIHEDPDVDAEDKFQYLMQAVTVGSRARELIESYPPTAENYPKVVDSLKQRALDTLGVTSDKCAAMLYPLVESCLPEDTLRAWQRYTPNSNGENGTESSKNRLASLLDFLRAEVEGEERIRLARAGFGLTSKREKHQKESNEEIPTAAGLFSGDGQNFHKSENSTPEEERLFQLSQNWSSE
ncbi:unnamed protein product [Allacma fusca]|uniref:Uncharacterized protein n=1 Tax=Allacma fusca TaxID=39272 RepID=A0A8J2K5U7_9HEXA|nr:unnamed protein product [Allacma fusca]